MAPDVVIRRAVREDAPVIAQLIGEFADEALMLRRTPEIVEQSIDDYFVAVRGGHALVACGALREYSPSVAEIAAIAVSREMHGCGVGRAIVAAVEQLALKRGVYDVFALTLQPAFFAAIGYQRVDRARYPEKIRRDCLSCARRFACTEVCFAKNLRTGLRAAA
jgi:N-acetylglutamate synthase-like GNAT family acetyltransferase